MIKFTKKIKLIALVSSISAASTVAIVTPIAIVYRNNANNTNDNSVDYSTIIDSNSSHDEIKSIVDRIINGEIKGYVLDGQKYDISSEKYNENIQPLVNYIKNYYPTIINPGDRSLADIPKINFSENEDFRNIVQVINPNQRFKPLVMPELPEGYYWEYANDELYQHTNLDGSKSTYWVKEISNFLVPNITPDGKTFTFKVRIASEYGHKILSEQVQEQEIKVQIKYTDDFISENDLAQYNSLLAEASKNSPTEFFKLNGWETSYSTFNDIPQTLKDEANKLVIPTKLDYSQLNRDKLKEILSSLKQLNEQLVNWGKKLLSPFVHQDYMPTVSLTGTAEEKVQQLKALADSFPPKVVCRNFPFQLSFKQELTPELIKTLFIRQLLGVEEGEIPFQTNKWKDAYKFFLMDHSHDDGVINPQIISIVDLNWDVKNGTDDVIYLNIAMGSSQESIQIQVER